MKNEIEKVLTEELLKSYTGGTIQQVDRGDVDDKTSCLDFSDGRIYYVMGGLSMIMWTKNRNSRPSRKYKIYPSLWRR